MTLGIPMLYYLDAGTLFPGRAEAVTGASLALPDQPSGQFEVLLNREKHGSSAAAWMDFSLTVRWTSSWRTCPV